MLTPRQDKHLSMMSDGHHPWERLRKMTEKQKRLERRMGTVLVR